MNAIVADGISAEIPSDSQHNRALFKKREAPVGYLAGLLVEFAHLTIAKALNS